MMASKGRMLWGLARAKVELPLMFFYCTLFFLAGFYGSLLLSPGLSGGHMPRGGYWKWKRKRWICPGCPTYGETGESLPPQPHQMVVIVAASRQWEEEEDSAIQLVHLLMSCADAVECGDADLAETITKEMWIVLM